MKLKNCVFWVLAVAHVSDVANVTNVTRYPTFNMTYNNQNTDARFYQNT